MRVSLNASPANMLQRKFSASVRISRLSAWWLYSPALVFMGIAMSGRALAAPAVAYQPLRHMYHESWTARDGAPANIEEAVPGPDGFLWIVSDNGLFRFDGVSFEPFDLALPFDHPQGLDRTEDGSMWIKWFYGSVSRVKDGLVTTVTPHDGLLDHQVVDIIQREDGSYWLAGRAGVQALRESAGGKLVVEPGLQMPAVISMAQDAEHNIWVVTGSGLQVMPRGKTEFVLGSDLATPDSLCRTVKQPGVLCAAQSLSAPIIRYQWRAGRVVQTVLTTDIGIRSFWAPGDGTLWVGTNHGIVRTRVASERTAPPEPLDIDRYNKLDGLSDETAYSISTDSEGSTWAVTTKGLDRFRTAPFSEININEPNAVALPHGRASAHTIVATDHLIDVSSGVAVAVSPQFDNAAWCRTLFRSDDDSLWVGTNSGHLYHFAHGKLSPQPPPPGIGSAPILAVMQDFSHGLWISVGSSKGVFRYDGQSWAAKGGQATLPDGSPPLIESDHEGGLWFGYRDDRVAYLSSSKVRVFGVADGLRVGNTKAFAQSGANIWVGGELGVSVLEDGRFYPLLVDGPFLNGVTGIAFAPDGALWINGALGVIRVSKEELDIKKLMAGHPAATRFFDYHDGIQGVPFPVYVESVWMDSNGKLYIANREHLQSIDPLIDQGNLQPPQVWIRAISGDGKLVRYPRTALTLRPNVEGVQVDFTATSLLVPDRVKFRYKLEGYDKDWIDAGSRRQAFYSKLPPAEYVFKVIASNDAGVWNTRGASLNLTVPPTFTQTYSFKTLCIVALIAVAWLLYRLRLMQTSRQLRARMVARLAERERIARDLHDTFFQAVQGLFLTINSVTKKMAKEDPFRVVVEDALRKSDKVMEEGRELVLDLRGDYTRGRPLDTQLNELGAEFAASSTAKFRLVVNGDTRELQGAASDELYWLGREAIANSFHHSGAHSIEVELDYGPRELRLRVRDNGAGIDEQTLQRGQKENHWGLPGMRERAKKIGARLDIWSGRNAGTEIEVRVPASSAYEKSSSTWRLRLARRLFAGSSLRE